MQIPDYISASYIKNCYKNTSLSKSKSSKKLASGYRINTAADDAAKLSISEKMRAQIRGLDQGVQNAQDAYSTLQVMDGKAQSCNGLLQRMRELTLQAANGTHTEQDRMIIQQEISELRNELGETLSNFWEGIHLVSPSPKCTLDDDSIQQKLKDFDLLEIDQPLCDEDSVIPKEASNILMGYLGMMQFVKDWTLKINAIPVGEKCITDELYKAIIDCLQKFVKKMPQTKGYGNDTVKWNVITQQLDAVQTNPTAQWASLENNISGYRNNTTHKSTMWWLLDSMLGLTFIISQGGTDLPAEEQRQKVLGRLNYCIRIQNGFLTALEELDKTDLYKSQLIEDFKAGSYEKVYRGMQDMVYGRNYNGTLREGIMNIQVGANVNHAFKLKLSSVACNRLFQKNVLSDEAANEMLEAIDTKLKGFANLIGKIGSYQNRLQHAMEYAMTHAEIETGAESRIRDTDYGKECVANAKQNLQQQVQETVFAEEKRRKEQINQFLFRNKS